MAHSPLALFADREDADLPLSKLYDGCYDFLMGREKPVSAATLRKYREVFASFTKSLAVHDKPLVISSVTPAAMRAWASDLRTGALPGARRRSSDGTIAPYFSCMKAFTRGYVFREAKLTSADLLADIERFKPGKSSKEMLTDDEITAIRDSFNLPTFEHVRDRAMFELHMATAFRFDTVLEVPLAALDKISGRLTVTIKGGKVMQGKLDSKALARVKAYLRLRPETNCPAMFVTDAGQAVSYDGGKMIWRRMKQRSGVKRLGSHLIRHTFAQRMALAGAAIGEIQDVLGHESAVMARHYAGAARTYAAADTMAKYSLAS
jgi:integrase/recombinase XerD